MSAPSDHESDALTCYRFTVQTAVDLGRALLAANAAILLLIRHSHAAPIHRLHSPLRRHP